MTFPPIDISSYVTSVLAWGVPMIAMVSFASWGVNKVFSSHVSSGGSGRAGFTNMLKEEFDGLDEKYGPAELKAHSLTSFEKAELRKKGLTNLESNPHFIYIGVRSPGVYKEVLKAGKFKVAATSEKVGIFATQYPAIVKDYAGKEGLRIFKIPFTSDLKESVIPDKLDRRMKQLRINKDIPLDNAYVRSGNEWVPCVIDEDFYK